MPEISFCGTDTLYQWPVQVELDKWPLSGAMVSPGGTPMDDRVEKIYLRKGMTHTIPMGMEGRVERARECSNPPLLKAGDTIKCTSSGDAMCPARFTAE